ncbi:hypothetical protein QR680_014358 [Steinernema hermaphroditum]|uniref:Serpentine receptor class gamma n=1 Tax=Steinernema hermaphroditum TaxID=289476 RepID=A0AA39M434_9BILA|nr:hypothetical protein QR680_014358 [Steinernema hermaphroditum]
MTLSSGNVLKIVLFYVAIGYSIPGYAALFITIYILSAKRFKNRFKYSFYTLFKVQCILDVCFQFTNAVMFRAAYSTLFNKLINETDVIKTGVFATAGYFIFYYFLFTSSFSVVLIAMNRVTIMVLPKSFRWYWKRHLSHLLIILFLLPIVFTWHIIAGGSFFVEYEDAYVPDHHKIFGIKNSGYTFVVHFVNDTFVLLVNLVIIAFVVINRRKQVEWLELKLFFLTMANFTFQLIRGMYQVSLGIP